MRKTMWKKGLTVAMAAAMLTGTIAVPTVFNNGVSIVKADEQNEGEYYVLMNIPYEQFYKNELSNNDVKVDAFTSATKAKTRTGSLVSGSYHVNSDGTDITGITYPVKVSKNTDLSKYKEVTDNDSVDITTTNRGQTSTVTYKGKDALFENASYSYYKLSEAPSYYKELTVNEDGSFSFGKTTANVTKVTGATADLLTDTTYGDYQLDMDFGKVEDHKIDGNTKVYAAVITTTDGTQYGLRHMENIWRGTELAWSTGFTTAVHNCPTSSDHYRSMMGKTINSVTYYTEDGVFEYALNDIYVPKKFDTADFAVENADVTAGKTSVKLPTALPVDYEAEYSVEGLKNAKVENGTLTYDTTSAKLGGYTVTVSDKKNVYAPFSTTFTLTTNKVVAAYNGNDSAPALVVANNATSAEFANFVESIKQVTVNGKSYAASGRGSVKLINEDGTLVTTADPFKEDGTYKIVVNATGYNTALEFTYTKGAATTATEPTTSTQPTTTTASKVATTTAVKPATKVTVKKQIAKVKAGKKKLTITWKKDKAVSGYQIKLATKKNFKGAKTYTVKSYKTYKKVIKKLKSKKKYYVKVRAYKTVGKSKVYGAYSATKSCKVK